MSAESQLLALLAGTPAVVAIVGERIRAQRVEQDEPMPLVTFARAGTEDFTDLSSGQVLASRASLTVQCWCKYQTDADALALLIANAVRAVGSHVVSAQVSAYDEALDACAAILTVEWWT